MKHILATAHVSAFCVLPLGAAFGQTPPAAAQEACRADAQRFCAGVQPGGSRIAKCLRTRLSELSPACKAIFCNIKTGRADRQIHPACR